MTSKNAENQIAASVPHTMSKSGDPETPTEAVTAVGGQETGEVELALEDNCWETMTKDLSIKDTSEHHDSQSEASFVTNPYTDYDSDPEVPHGENKELDQSRVDDERKMPNYPLDPSNSPVLPQPLQGVSSPANVLGRTDYWAFWSPVAPAVDRVKSSSTRKRYHCIKSGHEFIPIPQADSQTRKAPTQNAITSRRFKCEVCKYRDWESVMHFCGVGICGIIVCDACAVRLDTKR
ncbi:hypothetical protein MMC19_003584 [Ptychographa xylographoides]|nr:hypothetical protein [Ptychographa xylographoides]